MGAIFEICFDTIDGVKYVRYFKKGDATQKRFVSKRIPFSSVDSVIDEKGKIDYYKKKLKNSHDADLKREYSTIDCYFYVEAERVTNGNLGKNEPLVLFGPDGEQFTINNERTIRRWEAIFNEILKTPLADYTIPSSKNPWGRFDNSIDEDAILQFEDKDLKEAANKEINKQKQMSPTIKIEVSKNAPIGYSLSTVYQGMFRVYRRKERSKNNPNLNDIIEVHNKCFNKNGKFEQKSEQRTVSAELSKDRLDFWMNTQRKPDQITLMNNKSANEISDSEHLKLLNREKVDFEWLHLIAHSLGGPDVGTPQTIENLVFGTAATNTQMLIQEEFIKTALYYGNEVDLTVKATCANLDKDKYTTWFSTAIEYSYMIKKERNILFTKTYTFNPLNDLTPTLVEKLAFEAVLEIEPQLKKIRRLYGMMHVSPEFIKAEKIKTLETKTIQIGALKGTDLELCEVKNEEFVPVKNTLLFSNSNIHSDSFTYTAKTTVFGRNDLLLRGVCLENGQKHALLRFQKDNFNFTQLFSDFECENINFFIFDNVDIHVVGHSDSPESVISFSGTLKMDQGPLVPIAKLINIKDGIFISGEIDIGNQSIENKVKINGAVFKSAANFYIPFNKNISFTSTSLQLCLGQKFDYTTMKDTFTCDTNLLGTLEICNLLGKKVGLDFIAKYNSGTIHVCASTKDISDVFGVNGLNLNFIEIQFDIGRENDLSVCAYLSTGIRTYEFGGMVSENFSGLIASAENFSLSDLDGLFQSISDNFLSLPEYDIVFNNVTLGIANRDGIIGNRSIKQGLSLKSDINVHGHQCSADINISSDGVSFESDLKNADIGPIHLDTAKLQMSMYSKSSGKPTEFSILGDAQINGIKVQCKVCYEKSGSDWNCILYAGIDSKKLSLAGLLNIPEDSVINTISFEKAAFIYAARDCNTTDPIFSFSVKQGIQFIGAVKDIPPLSKLMRNKIGGFIFRAHFEKETDLSIESPKNMLLDLGKSVSCDPFKIDIRISPKPCFNLIFGINIGVPRQETPLHFDLLLGLEVLQARGAITMKNWWENPFGINGLKIGPALSIQLGIIYAQFLSTGTPSEFGFCGGLMIGDVEAQMAMNISEDVSREILMGKLARPEKGLGPNDLVKFASTLINLHLDGQLIPNFFHLYDLEIYCAPSGGTIGTIKFDPGFSFSAAMDLLGKRASVYTRFLGNAVVAKGHIDRFEIGPLKMHGKRGTDVEVDLEISSKTQQVLLDGEIDLFDNKIGILASISNEGITFDYEEDFLGSKYKIEGKSDTKEHSSISDFYLAAEFNNNLTNILAQKICEKVTEVCKAGDVGIQEAKRKVEAAEKAYNEELSKAQETLRQCQLYEEKQRKVFEENLENENKKYSYELSKAKKDVEDCKKAYDNALSDAQAKVDSAKNEYDKAMQSAQDVLSTAQKTYDDEMTGAQAAVDQAQQTYDNSLRAARDSLGSAENSVNCLARERDDAVNESRNLIWYEHIYKDIYLGPKILGLEAALLAAQGALEAAKGVLVAIEKGGDFAALNSAKLALEGVKQGVLYGNLEAAKRMVEFTKVGGEFTAFQGAQAALEAVKTGSEYTLWQGALKILDSVNAAGQAAVLVAQTAIDKIGETAVFVALKTAELGIEGVKRGASAVAFEGAKATLEAAKQGATEITKIAQYIGEHAGDAFTIKEFKIESSLKRITQGELFKANLKICLIGKEQNMNLDLNTKDVSDFFSKLFSRVLSEMKQTLFMNNLSNNLSNNRSNNRSM